MANIDGKPCHCDSLRMCLYHWAEWKKQNGIGYSDHPTETAPERISRVGKTKQVRRSAEHFRKDRKKVS